MDIRARDARGVELNARMETRGRTERKVGVNIVAVVCEFVGKSFTGSFGDGAIVSLRLGCEVDSFLEILGSLEFKDAIIVPG